MRTLLVLSLIALGLAGCSDRGRFAVGGSAGAVVMIDTETGDSWVLQRGTDGLVAWSPMGRRITQ